MSQAGGPSTSVTQQDIKWEVLPKARDVFGQIEAGYDQREIALMRAAFADYLCGYFNSCACDREQGDGISPVGATPGGGKCLKVRWKTPGSGKSGGLRVAVVAYCKGRRVVFAGAFHRREDEDLDGFFADVDDD